MGMGWWPVAATPLEMRGRVGWRVVKLEGEEEVRYKRRQMKPKVKPIPATMKSTSIRPIHQTSCSSLLTITLVEQSSRPDAPLDVRPRSFTGSCI